MYSNKLPIGTRIQFTKQLDAPATEDHPNIIYAERGELGTIIGHSAREGYKVKTDHWPHWFGASRTEFEPVPTEKTTGQ